MSEDVGVDHPGAENFDPAGAFANAAALLRHLGAERALDVDLCARLDEGEIARASTYADGAAVEPFGERPEHALELRERDVLVHEKPFDLVKHRRVGAVVVAAP